MELILGVQVLTVRKKGPRTVLFYTLYKLLVLLHFQCGIKLCILILDLFILRSKWSSFLFYFIIFFYSGSLNANSILTLHLDSGYWTAQFQIVFERIWKIAKSKLITSRKFWKFKPYTEGIIWKLFFFLHMYTYI